MKLVKSQPAKIAGMAALFGFVGFSSSAMAANVGLNALFANLIDNTEGILDIISFVSYVLCIAMTAFALFALKKHMENPGQNPFMKVLATGLTAASLGLLPTIINALKATVGGSTGNTTLEAATITDFSTGP